MCEFCVPDCHGVDQNFHDVTIVDMRDVPELSVFYSGIVDAEATVATGGH